MKRTSVSCSLSSLPLLTWLLAIPVVCQADHWERIHDIPSQGLSYYADTESVVIQGNFVRAWDRVVFTRPKSDSQGQLIFSQKYYKSYDCEERLSRNIQSIDYADRDSTAVVGEITHYSATWPLNIAASGTAEEKLVNFICNTAAKKLRTGR